MICRMMSFAEWIPIVKQNTYETFETAGQPNAQTMVGNVFIGIALMILATLLTVLFYWSFQKEKYLFITILCAVVFLYTIKMVILVAILRDKLNSIVFRLYMGSTAFMSLMTLMMMIYFAVKTSQRLRGTSSSSSYIPPPVQSYTSDGVM